MMTRVINLIGASGCGKTSVAKELEKTGYNIIQSYTTRPPRVEGEWGHTFIGEYRLFKGGSSEELIINDVANVKLHYRQDMIAYFNSYNSGHHYFATDEQVIRGKDNIYIVDNAGAQQVHEYYKDSDVEVITIYLQVDEPIRAERLAQRIGDKTILKYIDDYKSIPEVWSRLLPDRELFDVVECNYTVNANGSLKTVLERVRRCLE